MRLLASSLASSLASILASGFVAGCVTAEPLPPSPDVEPPPYVPEWEVAPAGTYRLTTSFEVSPDDLVADPAALTGSLLGYANHPGATLIAAGDATDDPALAVLRADLPGALLSALPGWIDEAVSPQGRLVVLGLEYGVRGSMNKFDLESELVVQGGIARHHLVAIEFPAYTQRFELGGEPGEALEGMPAITTAGWGLELGDHALATGVGAYAWDAVDAQSASLGGIRGALGTATQCSIVALSVATKCSGASCVGHVGELQQLCERGLDQIAVAGRDEASALRFTTLRLQSGHVGMLDDDKDHVADGLFGGVWTAEVHADAGTVELSPTFE